MKVFIGISLFLVGAGICSAQTLPLGTVSNPTSVTCTTCRLTADGVLVAL